jgi:hypothetical protein
MNRTLAIVLALGLVAVVMAETSVNGVCTFFLFFFQDG